jgi:hypothetical protein
MHPAGEANRGTGKIRHRCGDAGRQACIQQEKKIEGQEKSGTDAVMHARETCIQQERQTKGQEKSGTDVVMHARQTSIQQERQTEGQEKSGTDVGGRQTDMHSAGEVNRGTGKVRHRCGDACQTDMHLAGEINRGTGKVRNRCSDADRETCIQQERQTEEQEKSDAVMHARQTCIQLVRQTEGQEKSGTSQTCI